MFRDSVHLIRKMMDVISARSVGDEMKARLDTLQNHIRSVMTNGNPFDWSDVKNTLNDIERDILSGDWGGYYEAYRRPFIGRVDVLLTLIGESPPERPDYVFTQSRESYYQREIDSGRVSNVPPFVLRSMQARLQRQAQPQSTRVQSSSIPLFREVREKMYTQDVCSICLMSFTESDDSTPTYLVCKHRFHTACIKKWNNETCPVCKQDVYVL